MRLPPAVALEPRLARIVPWMAIVTLLLWYPLVLPPDHSWDDADPEILNHALRLAQGKPLYPPIDGPPWVVNPYTPLYFGAVALFGLVAAAWLEVATRGAFLACILGMNLLPYRTSEIAPVMIHWAGPFFAFFWLAAVRLRSRLRESALEPIDFYCVVVALTTIPSLGRVGAHGQYVLDMLVVTVLFLLRTGGFGFPAGRSA